MTDVTQPWIDAQQSKGLSGVSSLAQAAAELLAENTLLKRPPPPPPPTKRPFFVFPNAIPPAYRPSVFRKRGVEPCLYITTHTIDPNHDMIPDHVAIKNKIADWLEVYPEAEYLCLDWENPMHKYLAAGGKKKEMAHFFWRQTCDRIYGNYPNLLIGPWGLPTMPWWFKPPNSQYAEAFHRLPGPVQQDLILDAANDCFVIFKYSDCFFPGMYTRFRSTYAETIQLWQARAAAKLSVCGTRKPVFPCICWHDQHNWDSDNPPPYGIGINDLIGYNSMNETDVLLKGALPDHVAGASMWGVPRWWINFQCNLDTRINLTTRHLNPPVPS